MNHNLKQFLHKAQNVSLSEHKKEIIRSRIQEFVEMTPIQVEAKQITKLRSPHYISKFSVLNLSKAVSFALIVLIASGSTMSYASEDTLPGDTFYTVKVNFTEPIQESLALSKEAKLEVKTKQVEKRLTEAQTLLEKNDTNPEKHAEVEVRIEKEIEQITKEIDKLQEKGDVEVILNTTSKLQPVLQAHKEALQEVTGDKLTQIQEATEQKPEEVEEKETKTEVAGNLLETVERKLEEVEEKETKALEKFEELEKDSTQNEKVNQATSKQVEKALKEINQVKEEIEKTTVIQDQSTETQEIESFLDESISSIDKELSQDLKMISVIEAELLLEESKNLYEAGFYTKAYEKAQEALKVTQSLEAGKRIEEIQETIHTQNKVIQEESSEDTPQNTPSETTSTTETKIQVEIESNPNFEEQASQAIQALEAQLVSFNQ